MKKVISRLILKQSFTQLIIIILCIILAYPGLACSRDGYKQITINHELGSYSLEYPSYYEKDFREVLDFDIPFTHLLLDGPVIKEKVEIFDPDTGKIKTVVGKRGSSSIEVTISNYKIYHGNSYSATDRIEAVLKGKPKWANFKLLDRAPLTVSGLEGEMIEYLIDTLMPIPVEDGRNLDYVRIVYFDYNDLIWEIEATCNEDIQDRVKADFDHVIETFKILE